MVEQEENIVDLNEDEVATESGTRKRVLSEIEFPYADLEVASQLALALHRNAGGQADDAELAGWLDQSPNGGTYRARRSAARMFGLIELAQGQVVLTQLGRDLADDSKARQARVDAFLKPELYSAMYEACKATVLPPPPAIERIMVQKGVSPKQKERARQAFQKSAVYAGFIDASSNRFVKPANGQALPIEPVIVDKKEDRSGGGGDGTGRDDPLIAALIKKLPPTPAWPAADRVIWLRMAVMAFDMAYGRETEITVAVNTGGAS